MVSHGRTPGHRLRPTGLWRLDGQCANGAARPRCGQGTKRGTRPGKLAALDSGWRGAFHGQNDDVSLEEAGPNGHKSRVLGRNRLVFAEIHAETLPATMVGAKLANFGKAPVKKLAMDRKSS